MPKSIPQQALDAVTTFGTFRRKEASSENGQIQIYFDLPNVTMHLPV